MDITDWYWFEKVFNDKELELIDKVKDKYKEENANTFGASEDYRKSNIRWLPFDDTTEWIYRRLVDCMEEANMITYNFDWDGITENIQYTEYDAEYENKLRKKNLGESGKFASNATTSRTMGG